MRQFLYATVQPAIKNYSVLVCKKGGTLTVFYGIIKKLRSVITLDTCQESFVIDVFTRSPTSSRPCGREVTDPVVAIGC